MKSWFLACLLLCVAAAAFAAAPFTPPGPPDQTPPILPPGCGQPLAVTCALDDLILNAVHVVNDGCQWVNVTGVANGREVNFEGPCSTTATECSVMRSVDIAPHSTISLETGSCGVRRFTATVTDGQGQTAEIGCSRICP